MAFGALYFARELLDFRAAPLPRPGEAFLPWIAAREWLLAAQSEILFFALMCLIPAVPALYACLAHANPAFATLGCGTLAVAAPTLAMVDIVHGRFAFPVYGLRIDTGTTAEFAFAVYYGGLHSVQLMLGFAILMLTLAMKRSDFASPIRRSGFIAAAAAVLTGYPWVVGPLASLGLQAGVAAWWLAVGWTTCRLQEAVRPVVRLGGAS